MENLMGNELSGEAKTQETVGHVLEAVQSQNPPAEAGADKVPHPTRKVPHVAKPGSLPITFYKVLVRTARFFPDGVGRKSFAFGYEVAGHVMPWFPEHYERVRQEAFTPRVRQNLAGTTNLGKFRDGTGLSPYRRALMQVARDLLTCPRPVTEDELEALIQQASARLTRSVVDPKQETVCEEVPASAEGRGPTALSKVKTVISQFARGLSG